MLHEFGLLVLCTSSARLTYSQLHIATVDVIGASLT